MIISDWHMPIMDRLEFYKAVKKEVDLQDIPIPNGDRGRLQRKSGRSIEIGNP